MIETADGQVIEVKLKGDLVSIEMGDNYFPINDWRTARATAFVIIGLTQKLIEKEDKILTHDDHL